MTDDFDDAIRSRLRDSDIAPTGDARAVLADLQPAMRRARVKRSLTLGAATLSLVGLTGVGVAAVVNVARDEPAQVDFLDGEPLPNVVPTTLTPTPDAGDDESDVTDPSPTSSLPTTEVTAPSTTDAIVTSTTVPESTESTAPATTLPVSPSLTTSAAPSPTTSAPAAPPSTQAAGTTSPPTTEAATSTTAPLATNPPPSSGQQTVASNCGSITVAWTGDDISLTGTQPGSGFSVIVEDSGPDEVEVVFENDDAECEIKARIDGGSLRTDVDND